jgi:hypothetical protein
MSFTVLSGVQPRKRVARASFQASPSVLSAVALADFPAFSSSSRLPLKVAGTAPPSSSPSIGFGVAGSEVWGELLARSGVDSVAGDASAAETGAPGELLLLLWTELSSPQQKAHHIMGTLDFGRIEQPIHST